MTTRKVGILGPFGTYSHEVSIYPSALEHAVLSIHKAACNYFGDSGVEYQELSTIKGVFDALTSGHLDLGVVPQENSIFGAVIETYDVLRFVRNAFVCGEMALRVDHCLLVKTGVKMEDIRTVLSHEQALGQCLEFIKANLPQALTEPTTSTAAAARALLERPNDCAAISSRVCATLFQGLEVLKEAIQKERVNYTRFYVLAQTGLSETSTFYPTLPKPKALFRILSTEPHGPLGSQSSLTSIMRHLEDLDVTRIDRRPSFGDGIPFRDVYFLEVQGPFDRQRIGETWDAMIGKFMSHVQSLGMAIDLIGNW